MNLMYCGDRNIQEGLTLSILSLLRCTGEALHIYVLTVDLNLDDRQIEAVSDETIRVLDKLVRARSQGSFVRKIDISQEFKRCLPTANLATRFTPCCMLRLYADLIPDLPDTVLYLDNDILCRRDPSDFYHQALDGCEFVGVLDYYGSWFFRNRFWKRDYVNSGVMLLNLSQIRESGLFRKCRERCRDKQMFMPDQSALNKLAEAKRLAPRRYNEQRKLHSDTVFQHFTTSFRAYPPWIVSVKPWQIERVHEKLKLHEYDELLQEYQQFQDTNARSVSP